MTGLVTFIAATTLVSACGGGSGNPEEGGSGDTRESAQATVGTVVTKLSIVSPTGGSLLPFTVGQALARGEVPSGQVLAADVPEFQFVVKNRWPDGSAKFAVLSGRADMSAGAYRSIGLRVSTPPAEAAAITTAELKNRNLTASVSFSSFGTAGWSAGDWGTPVQTWISGPQMSAWTYRKQIGTDPHLVAWLEVRAYKGGRVEVMPWIENGYLKVASSTAKSGTASFSLGGTPRFSQSLTLLNHQRAVLASGTTLTHWTGGDPQVTPKHDTAHLMATKVVPNYRGATSASSALLDRLPASYTPLMQGSFSDTMGQTGYHGSIGLLPEWDAAYLTSGGDPRAYRAVMINGYAAGRYGIHYRDESTQRPLAFASHPNLVMGNGSGVRDIGSSSSGSYTPAASGTAPPVFATSHHPSMGYMAYLLSGWNYFLEENQLLATANYLKQSDSTRQQAKGIFETSAGTNTTRGAAWAVRTLAQAATITPDGDTLKAQFANSLSENIRYYHGRYVATPNNPLGLVQPYSSYTSSDPWTSASWMEDFFTAAFGYTKDLAAHHSTVQPQLDGFLAWKYRSVVGRLGGSGDGEFSYRYGAQYTVNYAPALSADWRNGTGPWYASWGQVARAMALPTTGNLGESLVSGYPTEATGYWGNLLPALAYAVDHAAPGAADAWKRVSSASNFGTLATAFNDDPVWGVMPRSAGGTSTGTGTTPTAPSTGTSTTSTGWTKIADEGQSFSVSGTQTVRYGANSSWIQKSVSGSVQCTNSFFGRDPLYGVAKRCEVGGTSTSTTAPSTGTTTTPPSTSTGTGTSTGTTAPSTGTSTTATGWTKIADEGQNFSVSGIQTVRYGANSSWIQKSVSSSGQCTNAFFGRDPLYGVAKRCEVGGTSTSTTAPSTGTGTTTTAPSTSTAPPAPTAIANLLPGQWLELPNTKIRSVLPNPVPAGDPATIVEAWNSAAVDTKRARLLVWGGGHADYWGNEMYALDLGTMSIKRIVESSARAGEASCTSALPDGTPTSRHTYDALSYIAHADAFYSVAGALTPCGGADDATWTYDFTANKWTLVKKGSGPTDYGTMAEYDPVTKKVFVKDQYNFYAYSLETNTYTRLNSAQMYVDYHMSGTIDSKRRKFVMIGDGVKVVDLATNQMTTLATSNAPAFVNSKQSPGIAYDPVADRIVAWHGGGNVHALNMDTGVWSQVATNAGPTASAPPAGTFGRWAYIPQYKVFALINDIDQNAWVFRLAK